jgi:hypothetical protein
MTRLAVGWVPHQSQLPQASWGKLKQITSCAAVPIAQRPTQTWQCASMQVQLLFQRPQASVHKGCQRVHSQLFLSSFCSHQRTLSDRQSFFTSRSHQLLHLRSQITLFLIYRSRIFGQNAVQGCSRGSCRLARQRSNRPLSNPHLRSESIAKCDAMNSRTDFLQARPSSRCSGIQRMRRDRRQVHLHLDQLLGFALESR